MPPHRDNRGLTDFFVGNLVAHKQLAWLGEGIVFKVIDAGEAIIDWGTEGKRRTPLDDITAIWQPARDKHRPRQRRSKSALAAKSRRVPFQLHEQGVVKDSVSASASLPELKRVPPPRELFKDAAKLSRRRTGRLRARQQATLGSSSRSELSPWLAEDDQHTLRRGKRRSGRRGTRGGRQHNEEPAQEGKSDGVGATDAAWDEVDAARDKLAEARKSARNLLEALDAEMPDAEGSPRSEQAAQAEAATVECEAALQAALAEVGQVDHSNTGEDMEQSLRQSARRLVRRESSLLPDAAGADLDSDSEWGGGELLHSVMLPRSIPELAHRVLLQDGQDKPSARLSFCCTPLSLQ